MSDAAIEATGLGGRKLETAWALIRALLWLYVFLLAIGLMGGAFKLLGRGFAEALISGTRQPVLGLFVGVLATSLAQSSSLTTSIVVGLVASGTLSPAVAVPVVMGANIGTSITNTIVSIGHITRPMEFRRAFAAATVHDIFNWCTVLVALPLEIATRFLTRFSLWVAGLLGGSAGLELHSPIKMITHPVIDAIEGALLETGFSPTGIAVFLLAGSLFLLFFSLASLTRTMKGLLLRRLQPILSSSLAHHPVLGILFGIVFTASVQSSSITTSLMVPMAAAGILNLQQIYPVTLGANIGTTVTALLAATVGTVDGLAVAVAHLTFNLFGVMIFYVNPWIRPMIPRAAQSLANGAAQSRVIVAAFVLGLFFLIPGLVIFIGRLL